MLDDLKDFYRQSLGEKIKAIKQNLMALRAGDKEAEKKLRSLAHSLHGSGKTYGFPDISEAAREVEHADKKQFLKELVVLITVMQDIAKEKPKPAEIEWKIQDNKNKILVIEHDQDISILLDLVLRKKFAKFEIEICHSALEAQNALQDTSYALIILALILPDGDGRTVLYEIKSGRNKDTPVFILSSIGNEVIRTECMELGASHFFNKPFEPASIAEEMGAIFHDHQIGTTFSGKQAKQQKDKNKKGYLKTGKILLAEDDELLVRVIKHRLDREGLEIEHAENGEIALKFLQANNYDLVILDVKMPVMDGFEVLSRFRENPATADTPVVMLTAMGSEKDIVRGYDLGATDYILKPFSPVELIARVKSLIRNS